MATPVPIQDLSANAFWSGAGNTQPPNDTQGTQLCAAIASASQAFSTVSVGSAGIAVTDPNAILTILNSSINYQLINQAGNQQFNFSSLSSAPIQLPVIGGAINNINVMASYYSNPAQGGDGLYYPYSKLNQLNGGDPITPDASGTFTLVFGGLQAPPKGWPPEIVPPANPGVTIQLQMGTGGTR